ncbi:MAG: hypothetical protein HY263_07435 [Chloroflexi bacterium]|nr:hypothetical protein [Chloroflexota bacterium]
MSLTRTAPSHPHTWRPMAFGNREPKHIRDPLCEPLWAGRRAIVHVDPDGVTIRDEEAAELEGFEALHEAIRTSNLAIDLVLDGYLMPGPLRSNPVADTAPGAESMLSPGQLTRQMFIGGGGSNRRREALERAEARRVVLEPEGPTAYIAIDLLWLDGQPLLDLPLLERRRLLESALAEADLVRRSVAVRPPVEAWYAQWKALGIAEFAVKDANSRYTPGGESPDWVAAPIPRR